MATRNEKLSRLRISSPCTASWDGMTGDQTRRHCAQCDRQVFDFAHMTPRQIEARIEATGGRLCARITRANDGRMVTLPPPEPPFDWAGRRASPFASALVTALLALRGAAAESAPSTAQEASASPEPAPDRSGARPAEAPGTARMAGFITDEGGTPLPGSNVALHGRDGSEIATAAGADGRFAFEGLTPGTYDLAANLEGFSPISHEGI